MYWQSTLAFINSQKWHPPIETAIATNKRQNQRIHPSQSCIAPKLPNQAPGTGCPRTAKTPKPTKSKSPKGSLSRSVEACIYQLPKVAIPGCDCFFVGFGWLSWVLNLYGRSCALRRDKAGDGFLDWGNWW